MAVRLQKYMADCGVASRRKCEELIKAGKVCVNGEIVTEMGYKLEPETARVEFEGKAISPSENLVYVALNKPVGYITSSKDQFNRPTVLDLVKDIDERLFPVGRLDYDSSGLIFLTNDGDFAYKMTHPKHNIPKEYLAGIGGKLSEASISELRRGVYLKGERRAKTKPCTVEIVSEKAEFSLYRVIISEGRNRQVRKMFETVGHTVVSLERTAIGDMRLADLKAGDYRFLSKGDIEEMFVQGEDDDRKTD